MDPQPLKPDRIEAARRGGVRRPPRHRQGQEFLRGPIPLNWLADAALLPGKALAVGIVIWFKAGATKNRSVRLCGALLAKLGINRKASYRGLASLEAADLVDVERHPGRCPVVTIREAKKDLT